MKLTYKCQVCDKQLKLAQVHKLGENLKLYEYTCGHIFIKSHEGVDKSLLNFEAKDGSGKRARHYQEDGIQFILETDFNAIIADQMRLGKTPQALLALANKYEDRTPCLILVRGANLWQWAREYKTWTDISMNGIFPILGTKAWIPPGFKSYVISMDTFSRPEMLEKLKKIEFKLVIADEAHSFKNTDSNRSQALVDFINFQNTGESQFQLKFTCSHCQYEWEDRGSQSFDKRLGTKSISKSSRCPKCSWYVYQSAGTLEKATEQRPCGLILLTGTPILNRTDEYFVPFNLVQPEKFSSLERFRRSWLEQDEDPVTGRLKPSWSRVKSRLIEPFKSEIKDFLLRREKEDVYKDLPQLNKIFTLIEPDKSTLTKQYNAILDKLEFELANKVNPTFWDFKGRLMGLRRLCGMMKLMWTSDYLESCALESANKYAIGIQHETVRDVLFMKLGGEQNCFKLSGEDSGERKDWIMRHWKESNKQFLIINMLAGGVGMDFSYCDNVLVLERQWNNEIERQFEFRFYNPDFSIKKNSTTVEYVIAKGTIDEQWYDMVENKKKAVGEVMYNNWNIETDTDSFRSLLERTVANRL